MLFFRWEGRDPVTPEAFLGFVIGYLEQVGELQLSVLAGEDLHATYYFSQKGHFRGT